MKKQLSALALIFILACVGITFTYADSTTSDGATSDSASTDDRDDTNTDSTTDKPTKEPMLVKPPLKVNTGILGAPIKVGSGGEMRDEIRAAKGEMKATADENRKLMQDNLEGFRGANKDAVKDLNLDEETKAALKALHEEMMAEAKPLLEKLRTEKDLEARKVILDELAAIGVKYAEKAKEIAPEAGTIIGERQKVMEENNMLRKENLDARQDFREERSAMVEKYKTAFMEKLKAKLDTISSEKLEKVLAKLETMAAKLEANTSIDAAKKEKLMAQIDALREIIEAKMDEYNIINDELNLEEIFE